MFANNNNNNLENINVENLNANENDELSEQEIKELFSNVIDLPFKEIFNQELSNLEELNKNVFKKNVESLVGYNEKVNEFIDSQLKESHTLPLNKIWFKRSVIALLPRAIIQEIQIKNEFEPILTKYIDIYTFIRTMNQQYRSIQDDFIINNNNSEKYYLYHINSVADNLKLKTISSIRKTNQYLAEMCHTENLTPTEILNYTDPQTFYDVCNTIHALNINILNKEINNLIIRFNLPESYSSQVSDIIINTIDIELIPSYNKENQFQLNKNIQALLFESFQAEQSFFSMLWIKIYKYTDIEFFYKQSVRDFEILQKQTLKEQSVHFDSYNNEINEHFNYKSSKENQLIDVIRQKTSELKEFLNSTTNNQQPNTNNLRKQETILAQMCKSIINQYLEFRNKDLSHTNKATTNSMKNALKEYIKTNDQETHQRLRIKYFGKLSNPQCNETMDRLFKKLDEAVKAQLQVQTTINKNENENRNANLKLDFNQLQQLRFIATMGTYKRNPGEVTQSQASGYKKQRR